MKRVGRIIQAPSNPVQISVSIDPENNASFSYVDHEGTRINDLLLRGVTSVLFYADPDNYDGPCRDFKIQVERPIGAEIQLAAGQYGKMRAGLFTSTDNYDAPDNAKSGQTPAIEIKVVKGARSKQLVSVPMNVIWTFGGSGPLAGSTYADDPDGYFEC
jgi:hypothetical protein